MRGRFGISLTFFPDPVMRIVLQALPWTLALVGVTTILAFVLGTLIGLVAALAAREHARQHPAARLRDHVGVPVLLARRCSLILAVRDLVSTGCRRAAATTPTTTAGLDLGFVGDVFRHAILPAADDPVTSIGGWILTMRNNMITVLAEDYVRMAPGEGPAAGASCSTYAGRNAILPNLTGFAMSLGFVVGGAILVEYVFNYPGVGYMLLNAVSRTRTTR